MKWVLLGGIGLVALERLARGGGGPLEASGLRDGWVVAVAAGAAWAASRRPVALLGVFLAGQLVLAAAAGDVRSTYYDGILVADPFGRHDAERLDRAREAALEAFARSVDLPAGTAVVADVAFGSYAPALRVVQPSPVQEPEAAARIARSVEERFGTAWTVVEAADGGFSLAPLTP